jgi:peptide/nickel transport system permease protein
LIVEDAEDNEGAAGPKSILEALVESRQGRFGVLLGLMIVGLVLAGPYLAPYDPNSINVGPPLASPSSQFVFGTDNLGRDVFSRFLHGGGNLLLIPVASVLLSLLIGGLPGMLAGYKGGLTDMIFARLFDVLMTLPPLLIVLVVINAAGTSDLVLIVTVGIVFAPRVGRVARGAVQGVVTMSYVMAAEARGESTTAILIREIAPNIAGPMIADIALRVSYGVIFVATLNFLGLGAQPPSPDWGLSVASSRAFLSAQPIATLAPASAIAAVAIAFNLCADTLSKHLTRERTGMML